MVNKVIAIFLPSLRGGGAERAMLNLAGGLVERGIKVDLVLTRAEGALLPELDPRVHLVDLRAARVLSTLPALRQYIQRARPPVILSNLPHLNLASILTRGLSSRGSRLVLVEHNNLALTSKHGIRRWERLFPAAIRWLYPFADAIVAVSAGVADGLAQQTGLRRDNITVIHNPIVTPQIAEKAAAPVEHPWFAAGQVPVIVAAGSLKVQKDYPTLLLAFAQIRKHREMRLFIMGDGELRTELEAMASELGIVANVEFAGFKDNPFAFFARSSVFVLSSAWEGFGNVLVEAMACGTQVVSTDCPSGPAEILAGGRFGHLVPVGNPSALAAAIEDALDYPIEVERLRERAQAFSVDVALEKYLDVLKVA